MSRAAHGDVASPHGNRAAAKRCCGVHSHSLGAGKSQGEQGSSHPSDLLPSFVGEGPMPFITKDHLIQHTNAEEVADLSAYPRVPLKVSPQELAIPLLM